MRFPWRSWWKWLRRRVFEAKVGNPVTWISSNKNETGEFRSNGRKHFGFL